MTNRVMLAALPVLTAATVAAGSSACDTSTQPETAQPGRHLVVLETGFVRGQGHFATCVDPTDENVEIDVPISALQDYGDDNGNGALQPGDPCPGH